MVSSGFAPLAAGVCAWPQAAATRVRDNALAASAVRRRNPKPAMRGPPCPINRFSSDPAILAHGTGGMEAQPIFWERSQNRQGDPRAWLKGLDMDVLRRWRPA